MKPEMQHLIEETAALPGLHTEPHRFGGTEFRLGQREIGHVHHHGLLDIPFTVPIRRVLVAEGRAQAHHILPDSGWISFYLHRMEDYAGARWLLRLSYLHARLSPRDQGELPPLDAEAEMALLGLSAELRAIFGPRLARRAQSESR